MNHIQPFSHFLVENYILPEIATQLFVEKFVLTELEDELGITLDLWDTKDYLELSKIEVPKAARGTGVGTEAMQRICDYADRVGKKIYLTPTKDFGATSIARLEQFYKGFGFVKKPKEDFSVRHTMVRYPI